MGAEQMGSLAVVHAEHHSCLETKLKREVGDLVLTCLNDDRTEDILLNPDGALWIKRIGENFARIGDLAASQAASALSTIAAWRGTVLNHEHPILETELPIDGSRFEGIVSPVVRRPVFAIRLRPRRMFQLVEYEAAGILTTKDDPLNRRRTQEAFFDQVRGQSHADIIRAALTRKKNILVVGSAGSGKTTFVNACLDALARIAPKDR
jgi:type IV secretion system protein VirB11